MSDNETGEEVHLRLRRRLNLHKSRRRHHLLILKALRRPLLLGDRSVRVGEGEPETLLQLYHLHHLHPRLLLLQYLLSILEGLHGRLGNVSLLPVASTAVDLTHYHLARPSQQPSPVSSDNMPPPPAMLVQQQPMGLFGPRSARSSMYQG